MALYIDIESETEQALELARFVSKLKSKGKETVENLINESEKNSEAEIIQKLLNETSILFSDASEKEVESFFFVITSLAKKLGDSQIEQYVTKIVNSVVSDNEDKPLLRMRVLQNLYNTLPVEGPHRYTVYRALLKYAASSRNSEAIFNQIKESDLDLKVSEWKLDAKQKRELFAQIRDMSLSTKSARNFKWSVKYLTSLSGEGEDANLSLDEAVKVIIEALKANNLFQFDSIMSSAVPIVSKLESSSNSNHKLAYQLLKIFVNGNQESYQQFAQQNPNFASSVGLNADDALRKIRLLSLATLASLALAANSSNSAIATSVPEISYASIAKSLNVAENEVEMWVISAISEKLISARMDQLRKVVIITGALQREFSENEWKQIGDSLNAWKKNVKVMLNTLQETKKLNPSQQHAAMSRALQQNQS